MKTVTVTAADRAPVQVQINGWDEADPLTGRMAEAATRTAFGLGAHATVTDGEDTWRVTQHGTRRVKVEG